MDQIIAFLRDFSPYTVIIRLVLAFLVGGIIGAERGKQGRAAGMRTHILVSIGAALTTMIGIYTAEILSFDSDPMRIAAQVISGIGFIGVGTILIKGGTQVTGLTTAAGLWAVGAIGLAIGVGFYEGALTAFVLFILTVSILQKIENHLYSKPSHDFLYIEINSDCAVSELLSLLHTTYQASELNVTPPRSGKNGNVGIEGIVPIEKLKLSMDEVVTALKSLECVVFILE
ncbi:MAG: MgtC/SapB family protein [Clostridia bacterium]|nr:MgtC/SapB family protein [Clostridia bacterium]